MINRDDNHTDIVKQTIITPIRPDRSHSSNLDASIPAVDPLLVHRL